MEAIVKDIIIGRTDTTMSDDAMTKIIAYLDPVIILEDVRLNGLTTQEKDGEETAKVMTGVHVSSVLKTLVPLAIILQKTSSETGGLVGGMDLTLKGPEIIPGFSTFDIHQEHPEIKALASRRMNKIHPADDITLRTMLPLLRLLLPHKMMGKILITDILCTVQSSIGNEPLCERGLLDAITVNDLFGKVVIIPIDHMLIFEMNRQTIDGRFFLMHRKFHNMPDPLHGTNVARANMIKYLIDIFTHTDGGTIMTLVYVLVDVLDGLDRGADLNIDMTIIPCGQKGIRRNDVAIVKGMTFVVGIGFTIIVSGILRITIFTKAGLRAIIHWIMLAAFTIDHARSVWVFRTAGTVHHALCDGLIKHGVSDRVRDLSGHDGIDMGSVTDLKGTLQKSKRWM